MLSVRELCTEYVDARGRVVKAAQDISFEVPAGKLVHAIVDNYAAHKHPNVRAWLGPPQAMDLPLHTHCCLHGSMPSRASSPS